ncbi:UDP-glycosyltransferase 87A1-like isoform X1 [Prosopis cineraria]|uniref:UDP-glycosyltransferase 87A1-like isoform X1 n=1 Tax=Prosopis cineraria TaxID=364024 RepID=UPI00240EB14D|nr:UDP-glycosyltransferase 87A1-like isoform X1 [Prosopis cineraria]
MEAPPCLKKHVVAVPFPTRGHVNPMMNLCKFLASRTSDVIITFVVTEEWLSYIESYPKPHTIRYATIPNVIPLESQILDDICRFSQAIVTKMRDAFEQLLDQLNPPVTAIVADVELVWPTSVAHKRNIPVALLWTMSASFFCTYLQLDYMLASGRRLAADLLDEEADEHISSSQLTDVRKLLQELDPTVLKIGLGCISEIAKTDYLLLNTTQELESEQINYIKSKFSFHLYPVGPAIPFLELEPSSDSSTTDSDHIIKWLDFQPNMSVLYISVGSFLSMSRPQMEELASALKGSGIRFLWACRSEAEWLREKCGDKGLVVPWCDQLKVLCHGSIVGFWSHGGWNSTVEACFAAVPILGFPIFLDQFSNCRHIAEEWKNGWKVGGERSESFVTKEEIVQVLEMVMDLESKEGKKIRDKAKELKPLFRGAIAKGGSFNMNLDAFVQDILDVHGDLSPVEKP